MMNSPTYSNLREEVTRGHLDIGKFNDQSVHMICEYPPDSPFWFETLVMVQGILIKFSELNFSKIDHYTR